MKGRIYHNNIFLAQKRLKSPLSGCWEGSGGQFLYCQTGGGEQGEWRQADGNFNIYNAREERGERWPHHTLPVNCHPWLGCRQATLKCPRKTISSLHPSCLCSLTALAPSCCQLGSSSLSIRILVKAIFQFSCCLKVCCLQSEPGCQWCSFPSVILSTSRCCPNLNLSVFSPPR